MSACEICKKTSPTHQCILYKNAGQTTPINLCLSHDQELFLIGQYRFVEKYREKLHSSFHIVSVARKKKDSDAA